jgi:hypothetical protein
VRALASLAIVVVAGCSDGVSWRIPCGGTGQFSDEAAVSESYRFEGDDAGHVTLEELTRGAVVTRTTSRYDGDVRVEHTFDDGTVQWQESATVEGGQQATVTRTGTRSEDRYVETWRWNGDRPRGWVRDYEAEVDREGIFGTGAGDALIENVCERDDAGTLSSCNSLRYDGGYARWTTRVRDDDSDGTPEGVELRSFDQHGLALIWEQRYGGADGRETLLFEQRTERDDDGSPQVRLTTVHQPGFDRTHTLTYLYACE